MKLTTFGLIKMKTVCVLFALMAVVVISIESIPIEDPNVRCIMTCDVNEFKPICGTNDEGKTRTFDNQCILRVENCLRNSNYQKTANNACP